MSYHTSPPPPTPPPSIPPPNESERGSMPKGLTREEVIRRRHRLLTQLVKFYKEDYWALMEEVRRKYREYLWSFGSPFVDERDDGGDTEQVKAIRCAHGSCKVKAMAMTRFCASHILSDSKQTLYKGCAHSMKSRHLLSSEKEVAKSLKKAGLNAQYSNKMAPMFHILSTEFAKEILSKRRTFREDTDGDRDVK